MCSQKHTEFLTVRFLVCLECTGSIWSLLSILTLLVSHQGSTVIKQTHLNFMDHLYLFFHFRSLTYSCNHYLSRFYIPFSKKPTSTPTGPRVANHTRGVSGWPNTSFPKSSISPFTPNSRLCLGFSGPPSPAAEGTQERSQRVFLAQDVVWEPALGLSSGLALSLHPQALPCVYRISFWSVRFVQQFRLYLL